MRASFGPAGNERANTGMATRVDESVVKRHAACLT